MAIIDSKSIKAYEVFAKENNSEVKVIRHSNITSGVQRKSYELNVKFLDGYICIQQYDGEFTPIELTYKHKTNSLEYLYVYEIDFFTKWFSKLLSKDYKCNYPFKIKSSSKELAFKLTANKFFNELLMMKANSIFNITSENDVVEFKYRIVSWQTYTTKELQEIVILFKNLIEIVLANVEDSQ